jgi:mono/diheme cytochrome c family protein
MRKLFSSVVVAALALAGCQGQTSPEPQIVPIRNMHEVPRYDAQSRSTYFDDHRTMRPQVPNTVAREMVVDPTLSSGLGDDGQYVATIPEPVVSAAGGMDALLARGQDRFAIYCVPCHGGLGDGQGLVPRVSGVAAITPPTFHSEIMRRMPDGQLFATISNGIRNMPAYGPQIPSADRWAIVGYVRALQLTGLNERTAMRTETDR